MHCHVSEAVKADLWRALVLWEYGGIYTDIDNAPTDEFKARNYIGDEDQAFFVIEGAFLSQYFYAAKPRHPMMYDCSAHVVTILEAYQRFQSVCSLCHGTRGYKNSLSSLHE